MRRSTSTWRCLGAVAVILPMLLGPLATAGHAAQAVGSDAVLAPKFVSGGQTAFYSAAWSNDGQSTLTNPIVIITLPAGSAFTSATPPVCTSATPAAASDPVQVTCPQDNFRRGTTITQQVLVRTPTAAAETTLTVSAKLTADEKGSDGDHSHPDTFYAPTRTVRLVPTAADAAGGCLPGGGEALSTRDGLSAANPLITSAAISAADPATCVPVTIEEKPRTSPTDSCGAGAKCTTDVAFTEFTQVPTPITQVPTPPPSSPIQLTFSVVANNKNLTWYKNAKAVADCPGATSLPKDTNACVNSRSKTGSTVRLGVLWLAGPDPSWTG